MLGCELDGVYFPAVVKVKFQRGGDIMVGNTDRMHSKSSCMVNQFRKCVVAVGPDGMAMQITWVARFHRSSLTRTAQQTDIAGDHLDQLFLGMGQYFQDVIFGAVPVDVIMHRVDISLLDLS